MATLYIMIGIPGAGKTTYAKNSISHAEYIGADALRKELYGKELTLRLLISLQDIDQSFVRQIFLRSFFLSYQKTKLEKQ